MKSALACALVAACTSGPRKDVTPGIGAETPAAAAKEAGLADPPALTAAEMQEHGLSRVTFGVREEDRARLQQLGIPAFLEEQLHPEQIDDGALDERLQAFDVLHKSSGDLVQQLASARK